MKLLNLEKKRMTMKRVTFLWLALSIVLPSLYLAVRSAHYHKAKMKDYRQVEDAIYIQKILTTDQQIDAAFKGITAKHHRRIAVDITLFIAFEIISFPLLSLYRKRKALYLEIENTIRAGKQHLRLRRELIPLP